MKKLLTSPPHPRPRGGTSRFFFNFLRVRDAEEGGHCALLFVVMRLVGLSRNGALALNIPPQSWKRYLSSTSCEADSLRDVGGCFGSLLGGLLICPYELHVSE
jgi:hypothetical protein